MYYPVVQVPIQNKISYLFIKSIYFLAQIHGLSKTEIGLPLIPQPSDTKLGHHGARRNGLKNFLIGKQQYAFNRKP